MKDTAQAGADLIKFLLQEASPEKASELRKALDDLEGLYNIPSSSREITLKSARENKGYTQKQAANLIGIAKNTLSNYERGKTYPDVSIIKRIEDVYGVSYANITFCP